MKSQLVEPEASLGGMPANIVECIFHSEATFLVKISTCFESFNITLLHDNAADRVNKCFLSSIDLVKINIDHVFFSLQMTFFRIK